MLLRTVAVLALALYAQVGVAQTSAPLRGLRSVRVWVGVDPTPAVTAADVDTFGLRVQIELELRRVGILVADTAGAELGLDLLFLDTAGGVVAYSYYLRLHEWVAVAYRTPAVRVYGTTWDRMGIILGGRSNVLARVQETVRSLTDSFLNDYLAANPPRRN